MNFQQRMIIEWKTTAVRELWVLSNANVAGKTTTKHQSLSIVSLISACMAQTNLYPITLFVFLPDQSFLLELAVSLGRPTNLDILND